MSGALMDRVVEADRIYDDDEISCLNPGRIPHHIAIIMDGNRRWAKKRGLPPMVGHWRGAETLTHIVRSASELGVKVLTVYAFSTENWRRSPLEVQAIMRLLRSYLLRQKTAMVEEGVKLQAIGDIPKLPQEVQRVLEDTISATEGGQKIELVLALNYGGRDELRRAIKNIATDCVRGKLKPEEISENLITSYLDTARWKDPQLLIRPGGESRLSNFLLWQVSYSEVLITDVLWPDFKDRDLLKAILDYQSREHRLGS